MKEKKSIALLITILFITSIMALITLNLKDSNEFIDVSSSVHNLTQTNIVINNVNNEIMKLVKENKENISTLLSAMPESLPLSYANVNLIIKIKEIIKDDMYSLHDYDIDSLKNKDDIIANIDYPYDFFDVILKDKNITNQRQINFAINEYINTTKDYKINNIKDKFTHINFKNNDNNQSNENNSTDTQFIACDYSIDVSGLQSQVSMVFKVGDLNTTYLDVYLKN